MYPQKPLQITVFINPGIRCEVDWSGPTMKSADVQTGEIIKVYLFVAKFPYSQYFYVEPWLDMKQDTWLRCYIHMYQFLGGVPVRTVCDNLKTGVSNIQKKVISSSITRSAWKSLLYRNVPIGIRKPKQKEFVEDCWENRNCNHWKTP